jgi:two-component system cell cycle sensor histidine kinase/response regulator CckA
VWIDPAQFEQVLINLAVNARDAMPQGGRLAINTDRGTVSDEQREGHGVPRARHGFVRLSVADTGTGMSEKVRAQIFEPFFTTKDPGKGTGIGLATVQSVVRTAGGFIEVESTLGKGTRFDIYLPATHERSPTRSDDPQDIPQASNEYVALVEDQAAVRALAQNQLQLLGYQVGAFASAEDALRALGPETQVDVLITDVVLRGMDGPTLVERLRERQPDLPVLYMSGYTDDHTLARGVDAASVHFLRKPFSIREIAQAVRNAIDGVRATTQQESD